MGFEKFHIFARNPKVLAYGFSKKFPVWGKNWPKLRISWSWPPYYELVIYNGPVFQFLGVLKNFTFLLEIQRCQPTVSPKTASLGQKLSETPYFLVVTPVLRIGYV
jgi:hypothetical protein